MKNLEPAIIFDACALVSLIKPQPTEKGIDLLEKYLDKFGMSPINIAEVVDVLLRKGADKSLVLNIIKFMVKEKFILDVDLEVANLAGEIRAKFAKPPYELSMADSFCLAHAKILKLPVVTADKVWLEVGEAIAVKVIQYK